MNDCFVNAVNSQQATSMWMNSLTENLINVYTPGYRSNEANFKTFMNGAILDVNDKKDEQGKATPGTSDENLYIEGRGMFKLRRPDGKVVYSRLGEFKFDKEGVYKDSNGYNVQGYILNDRGEIMQGAKKINSEELQESAMNGAVVDVPTTNIKLWIDPNNGKYLGKYDEFEVKGEGILYGKSDGGKNVVPLYKIAISNFHNPEGLFELKPGVYIETEDSGKPVVGVAEVSSGKLELSNVDFKANISYFRQAKLQMDLSNKLISTNKQLLDAVLQLLQ